MSLKIQLQYIKRRDEFVSQAYKIANSFLYELAVRNGVVYTPVNRVEFEQGKPRRLLTSTDQVRFPRIDIDPEVAQLYSFAETALANLPLAFLSFYQILEYFFPKAIRSMTIRGVRRELADPRFNGSNGDIIKIIAIAESGARSSEADQISALLEHSVREDRINEFLAGPDKQRHFGKQGPIKGVGSINPENPKESISSQVASRVYLLRNRIVHAKDDPKYANSKVLLPRSREAALLWPDVELVRLLAQEVITDSQV
ncbi:hypothetical protein [Nocardia asiatica]|uniref:hypothetical protein n=1 Tax=Nocardia asiatica TaxID=209252 RepID=UPI002454DC61|nr:hypothetical protein [Nocardia asiatica]